MAVKSEIVAEEIYADHYTSSVVHTQVHTYHFIGLMSLHHLRYTPKNNMKNYIFTSPTWSISALSSLILGFSKRTRLQICRFTDYE